MTQSEFNDLWTIEELPACPEGMALLKKWTDTLPPVANLKRFVLMALMDGVSSDEQSWLAFRQHLSNCDACDRV